MLLTRIDDLIAYLESRKTMTLSELSRLLEWNEHSVERVANRLERHGIVNVSYPANIFAKPSVTLLKPPEKKEYRGLEGEEIEAYTLKDESGEFFGTTRLVMLPGKKRAQYTALIPQLSEATRAYLKELKNEISGSINIGGAMRTKEEMQQESRARRGIIKKMLGSDLGIEGLKLELLSTIMNSEMFGLGSIDSLVVDRYLEEIVINTSKTPVLVYHRRLGWLKTNIGVKSEDATENLAAQIARRVGKQITLLNPVLDAHLLTGDRVNATLFPISSKGNTLTLRLFARNPWTITNYLSPKVGALSYEMAALLWQAVHYELNVLVAGGTASGKTSCLNGIVALIPQFQRVISIEDTRELSLPSYQWNWVPLATRAPNPEGAGEVKMLDLLVNSLRMRPDRIVMGEIRRKQEAEVLFEAMHTGHSVYATMHADTAAQLVKRLIDPPIEVPVAEVEDVHLMLVQYRDRRKNLRRTLELCEVVPGVGRPELNHLYRWNARTDTFQTVKPPHRYAQQMNLHTGMTDREIEEDMKNKKKVLMWMTEQGLTEVEQVGRVMKAYYTDEQVLVQAAEKKYEPSRVL